MKSNREQVLAWIGLSEGGYVNNPNDKGGATDRGITQRTFDAWNRSKGDPQRPVKGISKAQADAIITGQYLATVGFDDLPSGLDYAMADYAVNSGPARAVRELQAIVGVTQDGVMGVHTLAAMADHRFDAHDLVLILCARRMAFLRGLPGKSGWATFGTGWRARVMGNLDGAQDGDIGVIDRAARMAEGIPHVAIPAPLPVGPARAPELAGGVGLLAALISMIRKLMGG